MTRNHFLIAYDITDKSRLKLIHKTIQAHAIGGQKSLYECWLTQQELELLIETVQSIISTTSDRFYIFSIHHNNKRFFYGQAQTQQIFPFILS